MVGCGGGLVMTAAERAREVWRDLTSMEHGTVTGDVMMARIAEEIRRDREESASLLKAAGTFDDYRILADAIRGRA